MREYDNYSNRGAIVGFGSPSSERETQFQYQNMNNSSNQNDLLPKLASNDEKEKQKEEISKIDDLQNKMMTVFTFSPFITSSLQTVSDEIYKIMTQYYSKSYKIAPGFGKPYKKEIPRLWHFILDMFVNTTTCYISDSIYYKTINSTYNERVLKIVERIGNPVLSSTTYAIFNTFIHFLYEGKIVSKKENAQPKVNTTEIFKNLILSFGSHMLEEYIKQMIEARLIKKK